MIFRFWFDFARSRFILLMFNCFPYLNLFLLYPTSLISPRSRWYIFPSTSLHCLFIFFHSPQFSLSLSSPHFHFKFHKNFESTLHTRFCIYLRTENGRVFAEHEDSALSNERYIIHIYHSIPHFLFKFKILIDFLEMFSIDSINIQYMCVCNYRCGGSSGENLRWRANADYYDWDSPKGPWIRLINVISSILCYVDVLCALEYVKLTQSRKVWTYVYFKMNLRKV